jgi:hypothetical protein
MQNSELVEWWNFSSFGVEMETCQPRGLCGSIFMDPKPSYAMAKVL